VIEPPAAVVPDPVTDRQKAEAVDDFS